jgi:cytochrome o ubiquinol oxidase subunit 3
VTVGLAWLVLMMVQLSLRGFQDVVVRRLHCFSLFWHALDIIWVLIFTVVYLMGVLP